MVSAKKYNLDTHTHKQVITTYKANRTSVTAGRSHNAETLTEKWHIVSAEIITNLDTTVILYSGNHYTTITEKTQMIGRLEGKESQKYTRRNPQLGGRDHLK